MELAGRAIELASRALNSSAVINVALVSAFGLLSMRSFQQQRLIEALESEKQSLLNSNKAVKKTLWDSKQQLYAEASDPDTAVVPLSTLRAIYNDVPPPDVNAGKGNRKAAPSLI